MDNKYIFLAVALAILAGIGFLIFRPSVSNDAVVVPIKNVVADPKNATYSVGGELVTLENGSSIKGVEPPGSITTTKYFGNEVRGDFNGDGKTDVVFLLTQNSGGSGTFYYVAALLSSNSGYQGTKAVLLGDRIAPQTTNFMNGQIIVNYADRKPGEAMTTIPSVGTSKYFLVANGQLQEIIKTMSESDARAIAQASCIKGGEALGSGTYNETTKTWWFDANLNATKPGCNPACVVSVETKTAEINWRCTGALPPSGTNGNGSTPKACTMEAKVCPDGSSVGRTGPNCEFSPCPGGNNQQTACSAQSRQGDVCSQIYDPVCATVQIQCVKAPCNPVQQTFANACEACHNPLVSGYVAGECK
jgi:hypothetical protein